MIISIPKKGAKVVPLPSNPTTVVIAAQPNTLSLGQLRSVDISQAEANDVLMFDGTKWQAESLDGGEFN